MVVLVVVMLLLVLLDVEITYGDVICLVVQPANAPF